MAQRNDGQRAKAVAVTDIKIGDRVTDVDGVRSTVHAHHSSEVAPAQIVVELDNGDKYSLPIWLLKREEHAFSVPLSFQELKERYLLVTNRDDIDEMVIPVLDEQVVVHKREHVTGSVRISKQVRERDVDVDEPVYWEEVEVQRVPVGKFVEGPVEKRRNGNTLIIPVVEEVLVVSKRLKLVEEIHITTRRHRERAQKRFTVRSEDVAIEHAKNKVEQDGHM